MMELMHEDELIVDLPESITHENVGEVVTEMLAQLNGIAHIITSNHGTFKLVEDGGAYYAEIVLIEATGPEDADGNRPYSAFERVIKVDDLRPLRPH